MVRTLSTSDGTFSAWWPEAYDIDVREGTTSSFVCKRCGERIGYLTRHAARVHGDNITELPQRSASEYDEAGRELVCRHERHT
jgi:hypothetical protein